MNKNKFYCLFLLLCISLIKINAQAVSYTFEIEYEKKSKSKIKFPKRDSLYISLDYGFQNDIISIKTDKSTFSSDTLNSDNFYGSAGVLKISKDELSKPIKIYFNNQLIKEIKIKAKYSSVHLQLVRNEKLFIWRYHKYKFIYL